MAKVEQPDEVQLQAWKEFVEQLPDAPKKVAEKYDPFTLYKMKDTGQRVTILSYSDDGTVTVSVTAEYNFLTFERDVFGVDPNDLTECDLPNPNEQIGAVLTQNEVDANIDTLRVAIRPDLWAMDADGVAVRKS